MRHAKYLTLPSLAFLGIVALASAQEPKPVVVAVLDEETREGVESVVTRYAAGDETVFPTGSCGVVKLPCSIDNHISAEPLDGTYDPTGIARCLPSGTDLISKPKRDRRPTINAHRVLIIQNSAGEELHYKVRWHGIYLPPTGVRAGSAPRTSSFRGFGVFNEGHAQCKSTLQLSREITRIRDTGPAPSTQETIFGIPATDELTREVTGGMCRQWVGQSTRGFRQGVVSQLSTLISEQRARMVDQLRTSAQIETFKFQECAELLDDYDDYLEL